jgi:hypothetical protein
MKFSKNAPEVMNAKLLQKYAEMSGIDPSQAVLGPNGMLDIQDQEKLV